MISVYSREFFCPFYTEWKKRSGKTIKNKVQKFYVGKIEKNKFETKNTVPDYACVQIKVYC